MIATAFCARRSACSDRRRVPVKRQMMMIEASASMAESRPKPSSATELARIAAVIATAPSIGHVGEAQPRQQLRPPDQTVTCVLVGRVCRRRSCVAAGAYSPAAREWSSDGLLGRSVCVDECAAGVGERVEDVSCPRAGTSARPAVRSVRRWWPTRFSARLAIHARSHTHSSSPSRSATASVSRVGSPRALARRAAACDGVGAKVLDGSLPRAEGRGRAGRSDRQPSTTI